MFPQVFDLLVTLKTLLKSWNIDGKLWQRRKVGKEKGGRKERFPEAWDSLSPKWLICIISNCFIHLERCQSTTPQFPLPLPGSSSQWQSRKSREQLGCRPAWGLVHSWFAPIGISCWLLPWDPPRGIVKQLCPVGENGPLVLSPLFSEVIQFQSVIPVLLMLDQDLGFCLSQVSISFDWDVTHWPFLFVFILYGSIADEQYCVSFHNNVVLWLILF